MERQDALLVGSPCIDLKGESAMPFNDEEMIKVAQQRREAMSFAKAQGVIIGESHANPHGRGLVCNLIQAKAVNTLFMEIPDIPLPFDLIMRDQLADDATVGGWLRGVSQSANKDLSTQPDWVDNIKPYLQKICVPENLTNNPVKSTRLIEKAVSLGATIYFVDYDPEHHPGGNPHMPVNYAYSVGPKAASPEGMSLRDEYMLKKIIAVTQGGSRSGMALLCGSSHGKTAILESLNMGRVDVIEAAA